MEDEAMKILEDKVENHEGRLITLEKNWDGIDRRLLSVENTVLKQGSKTDELLTKLLAHHFDFKKHRWDFWAKVISVGVGSGGVIGTVVYLLLEKL